MRIESKTKKSCFSMLLHKVTFPDDNKKCLWFITKYCVFERKEIRRRTPILGKRCFPIFSDFIFCAHFIYETRRKKWNSLNKSYSNFNNFRSAEQKKFPPFFFCWGTRSLFIYAVKEHSHELRNQIFSLNCLNDNDICIVMFIWVVCATGWTFGFFLLPVWLFDG